MGLVGNALSFVVFSRRTFQNNSIKIYCRALALIDSISIIVQLVNDFAKYAGVDIYKPSLVMCKLSTYVSLTIPPISGWTLAALSVDQAISVRQLGNRFRFVRKSAFPMLLIAYSRQSRNLFHSSHLLESNSNRDHSRWIVDQ